MSYRNCVYNSRSRSVRLFTWDNDGKRIYRDEAVHPYFYVEDDNGDTQTIYGTRAKKRSFDNGYERSKFLRDSGIKRVFENMPVVQQFLLDEYWTVNETDWFSQYPLKTVFLDIETYSVDSFPNPENPTHPVNVITCYDNFKKEFFTFGTKPYTGTNKSINYIFCKNERDLFIKLIEYLEEDYPDILSGWNCEGFDFPYIINRCEKLLGEEYVKRLSPVDNVYFREIIGKFGKQQKRYYIDGISCLDYLDIYRRFCLKLRESYKLDAIGEIELGERKVDYGNINLSTLADTDWNTFVDYNVQDVNLLVKLEEKLQYISLLRMLSYVGLTTLEGAMGTISVINGALSIRARKRGEILSTFVRSQTAGKNPGAYVAEPRTGFKTNIVSFDANSLYPNVMISLNLSPETKIGRVEKTDHNTINIHHVSGKCFELTLEKFSAFIKAEECSITKAGFLFTQKRKGIIPEFLDYYYNERVKIQKELFELEKQILDLKKGTPEYRDLRFQIERQNTIQMVIKILINSCYGYMGNKQAPIGDDDIASSVTLTGQAIIKQAGTLLKQYLRERFHITDQGTLDDSWVYSDTDSCYFSLQCIEKKIPFKNNNGEVCDNFYKVVEDLNYYLNKEINTWSVKNLRTKDSRFIFKREYIGDVGLFLQKKRYVLHILDNKGIKQNKFKYTGVEVVRTSMPNAIKPYAKKIIETMLLTQSLHETNKILRETYDVFKTLPPEDIAFVMGVKGYEKYALGCSDYNIAKGTPIHVKAAYLHNLLNKKLGVDKNYESISSGDKIRFFYVEKPNKYGVEVIGYKYHLPVEYNTLFRPDYEKMFEKILYNSIERFYESVKWQIRKPTDTVQTELFDLFS